MNRQGGQSRQSQAVPPGYRSAQGGAQSSPSNGPNGLYYPQASSAGHQTSQQGGRAGVMGGQLQGVFPSATGALGRGGPPGFGARGSDPNDFPALGSLGQAFSSQAQTQGGSNHMQQLFLHQQQQHSEAGLAPPPPPGLAGTTSPGQPNGSSNEGLRDDFPALGEKERLVNLLKLGGPGSAQPGSPQASLNGPSGSQSTAETPSTNPPLLASAGGATSPPSWARQSPPHNEPLIRPVQQIMSSPVDKWGLKALLHEIRTQMGKGDRGMLMFGEDLSDLGVDVSVQEPLYSTFVTPWVEPSTVQHAPQIEDMFVIPSCYHVVPPPVETKLPNFSEETLFYIFYSAPQDIVQLMAAEELFNRGWRFHTELHVWITSGHLSQIDLTQSDSVSGPLRGPFTVFNPTTWTRQDTPSDFTVDVSLLEVTRPAAQIAAEKRVSKDGNSGSQQPGNQQQGSSSVASAARSPNGMGAGPAFQSLQAAAAH